MSSSDLGAQAFGGEVARGVPGQAERLCDRLAQQRVAERGEHQPERTLRHVVLLMPAGELVDKAPDGVEDRVQSVSIAAENHPRRQRASAFAPERVERAVDDLARVSLAAPGELDRLADMSRDLFSHGAGEFRLEARSRAEMVEEVGVRLANFGRNRLQRYRLRPLLNQQAARSFERRGAAFLRREALPHY